MAEENKSERVINEMMFGVAENIDNTWEVCIRLDGHNFYTDYQLSSQALADEVVNNILKHLGLEPVMLATPTRYEETVNIGAKQL